MVSLNASACGASYSLVGLIRSVLRELIRHPLAFPTITSAAEDEVLASVSHLVQTVITVLSSRILNSDHADPVQHMPSQELDNRSRSWTRENATVPDPEPTNGETAALFMEYLL